MWSGPIKSLTVNDSVLSTTNNLAFFTYGLATHFGETTTSDQIIAQLAFEMFHSFQHQFVPHNQINNFHLIFISAMNQVRLAVIAGTFPYSTIARGELESRPVGHNIIDAKFIMGLVSKQFLSLTLNDCEIALHAIAAFLLKGQVTPYWAEKCVVAYIADGGRPFKFNTKICGNIWYMVSRSYAHRSPLKQLIQHFEQQHLRLPNKLFGLETVAIVIEQMSNARIPNSEQSGAGEDRSIIILETISQQLARMSININQQTTVLETIAHDMDTISKNTYEMLRYMEDHSKLAENE